PGVSSGAPRATTRPATTDAAVRAPAPPSPRAPRGRPPRTALPPSYSRRPHQDSLHVPRRLERHIMANAGNQVELGAPRSRRELARQSEELGILLADHEPHATRQVLPGAPIVRHLAQAEHAQRPNQPLGTVRALDATLLGAGGL